MAKSAGLQFAPSNTGQAVVNNQISAFSEIKPQGFTKHHVRAGTGEARGATGGIMQESKSVVVHTSPPISAKRA
jgi:hypothetical protein